MSGNANSQSDGRIVMERTYVASIDDLWELWTTEEGIESWWGPEGFSTKVLSLDLSVGGQMRYAMTAVGPMQIQFMKQAGLPLTTETYLTYTEIVAGKSIAYTHRADFIPGVEPYDVVNRVEFHAENVSVRMVLTLSPMHNQEWTQRSVMGMESQLGKIPGIFAGRSSK